MAQAWERHQDETPPAYAAFIVYRDLGTGRSVDAAYARHGGHDAGTKKAPGSWKRWSTTHRWRERALEWDDRRQHVADRAVERVVAKDAAAKTRDELRKGRRDEHEDAEWRIRSLLLEQAEIMLKSSLFKKQSNKDTGQPEIVPARWNKRTAVEMAALASKLGRLSTRMPAAVADEQQPMDDAMYETSGQLDAELPDGAVPTMPADTFAKPDLASAVASDGGGAAKPDPRNRERPGD